MSEQADTGPVVDEAEVERMTVAVLDHVVRLLSSDRDGQEQPTAIITTPDGMSLETWAGACGAAYIVAVSAGYTPDNIVEMIALLRERSMESAELADEPPAADVVGAVEHTDNEKGSDHE